MIATFYRILTDRRILITAGLCALALMLLLQGTASARGGDSVFALQLAFTVENFRAVIVSWGAGGVAQFRGTLWLDYLFPIAYAIFLAGLIAALHPTRKGPGRGQAARAVAVPFLAAALDYGENTLHLVILADPTEPAASLVLLASIAATLKWIMIAIAFLVIIYYLVRQSRFYRTA